MVRARISIQKPTLGILTVADQTRPFRGNEENFIDLITMGESLGVDVYVVTAQELNLSEAIITGYRYDRKKKAWNKKLVPFPKVLYNRIPSREDELDPIVSRKIKECNRHPYVQLFNPYYFNKWTLFSWLRKSKTTRKYIPATRKVTPKLNLAHFIKTHKLIYLKPEKGKAGKGIMRVQRIAGSPPRYLLTIQERKKTFQHQFRKITSLWAKISQYMDNEPYIVQQGIQLTSYNNRPYDLRVLVQKNKKGKWVFTGIGARVAGEKSITTHVPRGGRIGDPQTVLTKSFGKKATMRILNQLRRNSLIIARQIERSSKHPLGEMSMDLGMDATGNIWFFEANAKPMKFDEPHIREKSLKRILEYSIYLNEKSTRTGMVKQ